MQRFADVRSRVWEHPNYPRWLLINCLVGLVSTSYTNTILAVSLKDVAADLNSSRGTIAWVITAPNLAGAVAVPILGRLGDLRGHRNVYLIGFAVSIVFNALTAAAPNPLWLITCRTIAQVGGAATVPASFAILFRAFPPGERLKAASWASAVLSGGSVAGLVIGGPIIDRIGWPPLFLMQAIIAAAAFGPALLILKPDPKSRERGIDLPGAALLAMTVFAVTFSVNRLFADGPSIMVFALLAVAPLTAMTLVKIERRTTTPILPLALVANRRIRSIAGTSFLLGAGWTGTFVVSPLLLQTVFGFSATSTSLITLARTLSITFSAPLASRAGTRFGERRVLQVGCACVAAAIGLLALGATTSTLSIVVGSLVLSGLAFGHVQPAIMTTVANSVDENHFGLATSLQQMSNSIGFVLGLGLLSAIAADATEPSRFGLAFAVSTVFMVSAAFVTLTLRAVRPTQS